MNNKLVEKVKKTHYEHLGMAAKFVLFLMADYANDDGYAWPSAETLAGIMGCDKKTVKRNRRKLIECGLLQVAQDQSCAEEYPGPHRPTVFKVNTTPQIQRGHNDTSRGGNLSNQGGHNDTSRGGNLSNQGGQSVHLEGAICPFRGGTVPPKPQYNHNITTTTTRAVEEKNVDNWNPNQNSYERALQVGANLNIEIPEFKKFLANGTHTPNNIDSAFQTWLTKRTTNRTLNHASGSDPPKKPHTHSYACKHVLEALGRTEQTAMPDAQACQLADQLNQQEQEPTS